LLNEVNKVVHKENVLSRCTE